MELKNNNHHTLFITLIIALFVLLILAFSRAHSYGAGLGFYESEVSGNEDVYENNSEDSEERAAIFSIESDEKVISDSEALLSGSIVTPQEYDEPSLDSAPFLGASESGDESEYLPLNIIRERDISASGNQYFIRYHGSYNYYINYALLTAGTTYIIEASGNVYVGSSVEVDSEVFLLSERTYTPQSDIYIIQYPISGNYLHVYVDNSGSGSGDTPDPTDPSGNDPEEPSGNDPSGNNPSGGGIELDGDLQNYLINYFGHKDYTVYDSEETFKGKKFFVSRYEYEVLKSLDDIKILLLCNVGILIIILFNGRRKRNAGN